MPGSLRSSPGNRRLRSSLRPSSSSSTRPSTRSSRSRPTTRDVCSRSYCIRMASTSARGASIDRNDGTVEDCTRPGHRGPGRTGCRRAVGRHLVDHFVVSERAGGYRACFRGVCRGARASLASSRRSRFERLGSWSCEIRPQHHRQRRRQPLTCWYGNRASACSRGSRFRCGSPK